MDSRYREYSPVVYCLVPIVLLICSSSASEFIHNSSAVLISKESSEKLLKHTNTTYGNAMYIHFAACPRTPNDHRLAGPSPNRNFYADARTDCRNSSPLCK